MLGIPYALVKNVLGIGLRVADVRHVFSEQKSITVAVTASASFLFLREEDSLLRHSHAVFLRLLVFGVSINDRTYAMYSISG